MSRKNNPAGGKADGLAGHYREIISLLGEDPERAELLKTPDRMEKAMLHLTSGYREDLDAILKGSIFDEKINDMVIVKDIEFYSLCEHHLLPFFGKCHVAYIPDNKIIGLSRMQVQERLTHQIAVTIQKALQPVGVGVVIEAKHMCVMMRGVENQNSVFSTSCMLGAFKKNPPTRAEFLSLLKNG